MLFGKNKKKPGHIEIFDAVLEGRYDKAIELLKSFTADNDIEDDYYFLMGKLLKKAGLLDNALQVQKNLLTTVDNSNEIRIIKNEICSILIALGKDDQAIEIMADLISDKSDDIELRKKLAEVLYRVGRYELSAEHYKKLADEEMVASCYYREGIKFIFDDSRFADFMHKALKYRKHFRSAKLDLANYYFSQSKNGKGLDLIIEIIYEDLPASVEDVYFARDKFVTFSSLGEFDRLMSKKINEGTTNPFYYIFVAEEAFINGNTQMAVQTLSNYLSQNISKLALRYYFKYIGDELLTNLYSDEYFYECYHCKATFKNFITICPSCDNVDSLTFL